MRMGSTGRLIDAARFDIRQAARQLMRSPLFLLLSLVSLALGIGFTITALSAGYNAYLEPLAIAQPRALYRVYTSHDEYFPQRYGTSPAAALGLYGATGAFRELAGARRDNFVIAAEDLKPVSASFEVVSPRYFPLLGVTPVRGRLLDPANPGEVVLGYDFWKRAFNGNPSVVGSVIRINGIPVMVAGIGPRDFRGVHRMNLMGNPLRLPSMAGYGLEIAGYVSPEKND